MLCKKNVIEVYKNILEIALNIAIFNLFVFLISAIFNGWNTIWFIISLCLILFLLLLTILFPWSRPKFPWIDNINSSTDELKRTIVDEFSSILGPLLNKHNFTLYHREISPYKVEIRYKRGKDMIIFNFHYFPMDLPEWRNVTVLISSRNLIRRWFVPLLKLKNPAELNKYKLEYPFVNPKTGWTDKEHIINIMSNIKEDFIKYAQDYLFGNSRSDKKRYSFSK